MCVPLYRSWTSAVQARRVTEAPVVDQLGARATIETRAQDNPGRRGIEDCGAECEEATHANQSSIGPNRMSALIAL